MALAVAGCGGGNSGGDSKPTPDEPDNGGPTVNLENKPGAIELTLLSGQGRISTKAEGDIFARLSRVSFVDTEGRDEMPPLGSALQVQLNSYQNQLARLNVAVRALNDPLTGLPLNSRLFQSMALDIDQAKVTNGGADVLVTSFKRRLPSGEIQKDDSGNDLISTGGITFGTNINVRAFPGRYTNLPVFLNDTMLGDLNIPAPPDSPNLTLDLQAFEDENQIDALGRLPGFVSDYISFDISNLSDSFKPLLSSGSVAQRVYFSGDAYAVSGTGPSGAFESLTQVYNPANPYVTGVLRPPSGLPNPPGVSGSTIFATYSLQQIDPTDPFSSAHITSIQGILRDVSKMIKSPTGEFAVTFPSSFDNDSQDIVFVKQDGTGGNWGKITNLYFGTINYSDRKIRLYPLKDLVTAIPSPGDEVVVDVSSMLSGSGGATNDAAAVRSGVYSNLTLPGFSGTTGTYVVYRK